MGDATTVANDRKITACFTGGASGLAFWAFRYFLGRSTIHTTVFVDELAEAWPRLSDEVKDMIRGELEKAFSLDDKLRADPITSPFYYPLGRDLDRQAWGKVRHCYTAAQSLSHTTPK